MNLLAWRWVKSGRYRYQLSGETWIAKKSEANWIVENDYPYFIGANLELEWTREDGIFLYRKKGPVIIGANGVVIWRRDGEKAEPDPEWSIEDEME